MTTFIIATTPVEIEAETVEAAVEQWVEGFKGKTRLELSVGDTDFSEVQTVEVELVRKVDIR